MSKTLRSATLAAGLVGLLGMNSAANVPSRKYSSDAPALSQEDKSIKYFLNDFGQEDEKRYNVNLGKAVRDLKELGLLLSEPELRFFRSREDIISEASAERIYVVGRVSDSKFKNGMTSYSLDVKEDNNLEYELNQLLISDEQIRAEESPDMAIYKSIFYLLSAHPFMQSAMKGIETDRSKYYDEESFIRARNESTSEAQWLNHQVTTSLYQGILMEKGTSMGFKKKAIIKELKDHREEGLMRNECIKPSIRAALFLDYMHNPSGLYKKFRALEDKKPR